VSESRICLGRRIVATGSLLLALASLQGCHFIRGEGACYKPAPYATAEDRAPLRIPPELKALDTNQALRIPALNEPEPPLRKKGEPCLDAPPPYAVPKPAPRPAA
jgi:hypothetical protein